MGQSHSQSDGATPPPPPVKTLDQFLYRFRSVLPVICIRSARNKLWLDAIFDRFASTPASSPEATWDQSSLLAFLRIVVPEQLWRDVDVAAPILYRCISRIGLFPYHNVHPDVTWPTLEVISVALVILSGRFGEPTLRLGPADDEPYQLAWDRWFCRLLFQCMSTDGAVPEPAVRGPADDEHLLQAHKVVESRNKVRDWDRPKILIRGDPIITVQDLPSSRSQCVDGVVPQHEFQSLVKLLLFFQLSAVEFEPGDMCNEPERLDSATKSVSSAFLDPGADEGSGIKWETFAAAAREACPNFLNMGFHSLGLLFIPYERSPLLSDVNLQTVAKQTEEASALIRQALSPTVKNPPLKGAVFDFATFAQIYAILPLPTNLHDPNAPVTVLHSTSGSDCDLGALKSQLDREQRRRRPIVLLVSGPSARFGAFLPGAIELQEGGHDVKAVDQDQRGLVFQLEPTLRVVGGLYGRRVQVELSAVGLQLSVSSGQGQGHICLGENGRFGSFSLLSGPGGRFEDLYVQFEVDAMDVVGY
ncbi:hypothetical protein MCOR25_009338 [Pyricularia grisea]|nr:hypothetical protein MCOR25_009338 [Pyricularia grisea]